MITFLSRKSLQRIPAKTPYIPPPSNLNSHISEFTKFKEGMKKYMESPIKSEKALFSDDSISDQEEDQMYDRKPKKTKRRKKESSVESLGLGFNDSIKSKSEEEISNNGKKSKGRKANSIQGKKKSNKKLIKLGDKKKRSIPKSKEPVKTKKEFKRKYIDSEVIEESKPQSIQQHEDPEFSDDPKSESSEEEGQITPPVKRSVKKSQNKTKKVAKTMKYKEDIETKYTPPVTRKKRGMSRDSSIPKVRGNKSKMMNKKKLKLKRVKRSSALNEKGMVPRKEATPPVIMKDDTSSIKRNGVLSSSKPSKKSRKRKKKKTPPVIIKSKSKSKQNEEVYKESSIKSGTESIDSVIHSMSKKPSLESLRSGNKKFLKKSVDVDIEEKFKLIFGSDGEQNPKREDTPPIKRKIVISEKIDSKKELKTPIQVSKKSTSRIKKKRQKRKVKHSNEESIIKNNISLEKDKTKENNKILKTPAQVTKRSNSRANKKKQKRKIKPKESDDEIIIVNNKKESVMREQDRDSAEADFMKAFKKKNSMFEGSNLAYSRSVSQTPPVVDRMRNEERSKSRNKECDLDDFYSIPKKKDVNGIKRSERSSKEVKQVKSKERRERKKKKRTHEVDMNDPDEFLNFRKKSVSKKSKKRKRIKKKKKKDKVKLEDVISKIENKKKKRKQRKKVISKKKKLAE